MSKPSHRRASLAALVAVAVIAIAGVAVVMITRQAPPAVAAESALPDSTGMGEVELVVGDLDPMVEFYSEGVGLALLERDGESAVLGADGEPLLRLVVNTDLAADDRTEAGLYHSAFLYDAQEELASAVARVAGAFPASFQGASDHTVGNAFYFGDPEGNGVELYVDMPRDTWTWVDGQVTMGTYALDPNAYLQEHLPPAGPTARATGVTMGHVHLRGGDIEVAERFYVDVIGMAVTSRIDSAVFLSAGGYHHHLAVNTWSSAGAATRPESRGLSHLTIAVPDGAAIDAVAERARAAGVDVERTDEGLTLLDPWGTRVIIRVHGSPATVG